MSFASLNPRSCIPVLASVVAVSVKSTAARVTLYHSVSAHLYMPQSSPDICLQHTMSRAYLVAYNSVQTAGWSYLLYQTVSHLAAGKSIYSLYEVTSRTLQVFQTAALLEILHAVLGLVRSSVQVTAQQVWSR